MQVNEITLKITNFDNQAMQDFRSIEVAQILRKLAATVEEYGVVHTFEGRRLMDSNGNQVGECDCDWEEDPDEEVTASSLIEDGWEANKTSLYDEEGIEGWRWYDPKGDCIGPDGQEMVVVGDWDEEPPIPEHLA